MRHIEILVGLGARLEPWERYTKVFTSNDISQSDSWIMRRIEMTNRIESAFKILIDSIAGINSVCAIGLSGNIKPNPEPGKGDFDIFIYCDSVPNDQIRSHCLTSLGDRIENIEMNVFKNEEWGQSDFCTINGIDTWLMYFEKLEVEKNIQDILKGKYLKRSDNYYFPIGRLGMFKNLTVLYDSEDFLNNIRLELRGYPQELKKNMISYNLEAVKDYEDLERAVDRKDVLFYHFAMDVALDHFLLALFGINETYFPSRKRSMKYIEHFEIKPERSGERLLSIIKDGSAEETLQQSFEEFKALCDEMERCAKS